MSSVLVIGSQGALGSTVVRAFEHAGWEVHRAARRPGTSFRLVDLDAPETLDRALDGIDVTVNTVPHPALSAERAVLERGGTLVNIASVPAAASRELRSPSRGARGTVVMNAGIVPGVTNLIAASLVEAHPEADTVEIALALSASATSGRAGREFVHHHLTSARRHGTALIPFPEPIGERRCVAIAEAERGWLGTGAGSRSVTTYLCIAERPLHAAVLAANRLGALTLLPRAAFVSGRGAGAGEPTREPFAEWVSVRRDGRRLAARTIEGKGDYRSTAAVAVAFADALLERGDALPAGCFDPEDLFTLDELASRLHQAGISIVDRSPSPA
jgi:hypothetical protein